MRCLLALSEFWFLVSLGVYPTVLYDYSGAPFDHVFVLVKGVCGLEDPAHVGASRD